MLVCAKCSVHACDRMDIGAMPKNCPSREKPPEAVLAEYTCDANLEFGKHASEVSMSKNGPRPRILEFIDVAKRCRYQKIGLAFCVGFANEAKLLTKVLEYHGFQVESVICKVGGIDKQLQGIENGGNAMCNPILQAKLLNSYHTNINIALGLCVGHDSMFFRYSHAPVTVMATKDKVLGHNPMAALYLSDGYYKNILFPPHETT